MRKIKLHWRGLRCSYVVCLFIKGPYSFSPTETSSCGPHKTQKQKITILQQIKVSENVPRNEKVKNQKTKNLKYQYLLHTRSVSTYEQSVIIYHNKIAQGLTLELS